MTSVKNPFKTFFFDSSELLFSDSEIKRDAIIWKIKKRKAAINLLLFILSLPVIFVVVLLYIGWIDQHIEHRFLHYLLGIKGGLMIIVLVISAKVHFEIDPRFVKVKHKGKHYN